MDEKWRGELPGQKPRRMGPLQIIGLIIGIAFAQTVAKNVSVSILTPIGGAYLCGFVIIFIVNKAMKGTIKPMMPALVMQTGYFIYVFFGMILTKSYSILDIAIVLIGLIWLLSKPGFWPVVLLSVYNSIGIFMNVTKINSVVSSVQMTVLIHIFLKCLIIIYLLWGIVKIHKDTKSHDIK